MWMMIKKICVLLYTAGLQCTLAASPDVFLGNPLTLGRLASVNVVSERTRLLEGLRLNFATDDDPKLVALLRIVNERLAAEKCGFVILYQVDENSREWWTAVSDMHLSECVEMHAMGAENRRHWLENASCWRVVELLISNWAAIDPLHYASAMVLSTSHGAKYESLEEHMQRRRGAR